MYNAKVPKIVFGKIKKTGESIHLSLPTWDCGWYWSFGYLGNQNCCYHLDSYQSEAGFGEHRNIDMFDALKSDYNLCPSLQEDNNLWKFCELSKTAYSLIEVAGIFNRGGSHYGPNPCAAALKNPEWVKHINEVLLPQIFLEIEKLLGL